jgi:hypothetical protein
MRTSSGLDFQSFFPNAVAGCHDSLLTIIVFYIPAICCSHSSSLRLQSTILCTAATLKKSRLLCPFFDLLFVTVDQF